MPRKIQIQERVESNFNFSDWSKNRNLLFHGIANKWQGDLLYEDGFVIFSSAYAPSLNFVDENDPSSERKFKSFEIEQMGFTEKHLKSNFGIGIKAPEEIGYDDIETTEQTKASFRFSGLIPVNRISSCFVELKDSLNYQLPKIDERTKKWINEEVNIEPDIYVEVGLMIELENSKSIMIKYIKDFELYFALIGEKSEIIKKNYYFEQIQIVGKSQSLGIEEKTIYERN